MKNQPQPRSISELLSNFRPIAGGDGTDEVTPEQIRERVENLAEVSREDLAELESELRESIDGAREAQNVELLTAIADAVDAIAAEGTRRDEADAETQRQMDEQLARLDGEGEEGTEGEGEGEGGEGEPAEGTEPAEGSGDGEGEGEPAEPAEPAPAQPEGIAAGAQPAPGAARRRQAAGRRPRPADQPETRLATLTAAAGAGPEFRAGDEVSVDQLADIFMDRFEQVATVVAAGGGHVGDKHYVARARFGYPEERSLAASASAGLDNSRKVRTVLQEAMSQTLDALAAAGGICAPTPVRYDLPGISTTSRRLRDALASFNADRGGVRFVEPPRLADIVTADSGDRSDASVGVYTLAEDTSGAAYPKGCQTLVCGDEVEVFVDFITKCLRVGNFNRRTFREQFDRFWQLASVAHDRVAEDRIWDRMAALSTPIEVGRTFGTARDVLRGLDVAVAGFKSHDRMDDGAVLRFFAPDWLRAQMRADLAAQLPGDNTLSVADAVIDGYFRDRNVQPVWSPDAGGQYFDPQDTGELNHWPDTAETILTHEGAFAHLDGGTLDFGVEIRDSVMNETNDSMAFMETFENVAFFGIKSWALTFTTCADGSSSGAIEPELPGCPPAGS